ncbi:MAG: restriction endonuclease subunit S [Eubacterium sp.]|nr:restriction endonuclease subunit S [Eubacterium sp.]
MIVRSRRYHLIVNDNLLQQMESLYKAWFKDYVPFGGQCPPEWKVSDIYSIAEIIYGAPFASKLFNTDGDGLPIIRIRDLKEQAFVTYTTEQHPKGHLIQPGDIVVGMDGEFRPYIWGNTEAWLNQRVCIFDNKRPKGKAFVLFTIKPLLYKIEQTQVATTVIHIGKKDYDAFEFLLPDNDTLDQFDSITAPMIDQIVNNRLENKRLAEMRDALLPWLMSGELDVSELDL